VITFVSKNCLRILTGQAIKLLFFKIFNCDGGSSYNQGHLIIRQMWYITCLCTYGNFIYFLVGCSHSQLHFNVTMSCHLTLLQEVLSTRCSIKEAKLFVILHSIEFQACSLQYTLNCTTRCKIVTGYIYLRYWI